MVAPEQAVAGSSKSCSSAGSEPRFAHPDVALKNNATPAVDSCNDLFPESGSTPSGDFDDASGRSVDVNEGQSLHGAAAAGGASAEAAPSMGLLQLLPRATDMLSAGKHLGRLLARGLLAGVATVALGIVPLGLTARWAGNDLVAQHTEPHGGFKTMNYSLRAVEPGKDGSFVAFWLVCYLAHTLFPIGSILAATVAWKDRAGLGVARCVAAVVTSLAMFGYLFTVRMMYLRRQLSFMDMVDAANGAFLIWAIGAFCILSSWRHKCTVALLVITFGACYWVCNEMIWRAACKQLNFKGVVLAASAVNLLRILMVEIALFAAVRLPNATQGAVTSFAAVAVALNVTVGHAIAFSADSMPLLLLTQLVHFTLEVTRSFYLLKGKSELDRVVGCLRAVCSAASLLRAKVCGSRHRSAMTSVMREPGPPEGADVGGSTSPRQRLREQALADVISLTNIAEITSLIAMACLLPLARIDPSRLEAGRSLPLHQLVPTILLAELVTDFTIAVMSGRRARTRQSTYGYRSTVQVWDGVFASSLAQGCAMCVACLAAVDTACNMVEAMCIIQAPDGSPVLAPCTLSWFNSI